MPIGKLIITSMASGFDGGPGNVGTERVEKDVGPVPLLAEILADDAEPEFCREAQHPLPICCRRGDIDQMSDEELQDIVMTANLTPRKYLGFLTPFQAIIKELGKDVQIRFA
jgi:hypothetical protein